MIRLPPISNRMTPSFPTRLSSDLGDDHQAPGEQQHHDRQEIVEKACVSDHLARLVEERPRCLEPGACKSAGLEQVIGAPRAAAGGAASLRERPENDVCARREAVQELGRAHGCTPVTYAHLGFRLLLEKKTHTG